MGDGRVLRFVLEVALLVGLAVALGLADVRPVGIVVAMALAWVVVALVEWVALREVPHYGSGYPPTYELPQRSLPPPRPIEQLGPYPTVREIEAPTWIARAGELEEAGADWPIPPIAYDEPLPVVVAPGTPAPGEPEVVAEPEGAREGVFAPAGAASDPWYVQGLPAEPLAGAPQARLAVHHIDPPEETPERRVFRRRREPGGPLVEFPVLPRHAPLPGGGR
jgi:hypothetical protein